MQKRPDGAGRRLAGHGGGSSLGDVMSIGGGIGRRDPAPPRPISLPTLSILNTDADIDPADLKAGEAAAREAGLS